MDDLIALLQAAVAKRASDVYFLPQRDHYEVVTRLAQSVTARITVETVVAERWLLYVLYHADMDVTDRRRAQLGRVRLARLDVDIRVSAVGDFAGRPTMVLRLLYGIPPVTPEALPVLNKLTALVQRRGMLVLCGPTGSGKSTLLYQLAARYTPNQMVLTIEDPVEIIHEAFLQLQVNDDAGQTYAALLKTALRHRPDVLVIGEIRDRETALLACEAALSGHLVLTTIHARSAALVPARFESLGVPKRLIDAALVASASVSLQWLPTIHPEVEVMEWPDKGARPVQTAQ